MVRCLPTKTPQPKAVGFLFIISLVANGRVLTLPYKETVIACKIATDFSKQSYRTMGKNRQRRLAAGILICMEPHHFPWAKSLPRSST